CNFSVLLEELGKPGCDTFDGVRDEGRPRDRSEPTAAPHEACVEAANHSLLPRTAGQSLRRQVLSVSVAALQPDRKQCASYAVGATIRERAHTRPRCVDWSRMSTSLTSVGDDWLAVITIFAPALIPVMYALGLWIAFRGERRQPDS